MIEISVLVLLLVFHFISDFIFQSDEIAVNKCHDIQCLLLHGFLYSLLFMWFGFWFAIITFILHTFIDFFASKATAHFFETDQRHWFFVTIGFDQLLHILCLIATYKIFY